MMDIQYIIGILNKINAYKDIAHITIPMSERDGILSKANDLLEQKFVFDRPWDMERCIKPYQLKNLDWETVCHDDEEWCFMLNRMEYLETLVQAYIMTKDMKYMQKAKYYILHWISAHASIIPKRSTRTLDTSIRIMSIFETVQYLFYFGIINETEIEKIFTSIYQQMVYIKEQYRVKYTLSNWGSIQVGILRILLYLYPLEDSLRTWVYKEFQKQLQIQIYHDGLHWEQSTMYHVEVLNVLLKLMYYERIFNASWDKGVSDTAFSMTQALYHLSMPTGEIECFGDSDRTNISSVMMKAAYLFRNGIFKFFGNACFDAECTVCFGNQAAVKYSEIVSDIPKQLCFDGVDAGMFTVRNHWGIHANFMMFTNGSLGSGHGHCDNLHFSICMNGKPILIDCGRYTYREDHPQRIYLKSMYAHNSLIVDDRPGCIPNGSWTYEKFGIPLKSYVRHIGDIHYYEGEMIMQNPLQIWSRKIVMIDCGIWFIADEVKCDGEHQVKRYFHFDPTLSDVPEDLWTYDGELATGDQYCSLEYNINHTHKVAVLKNRFTDETNLITTFQQVSFKVTDVYVCQANEKILSQDIVHAKRFELSEMESYTIALFHKEIYEGRKIMHIYDTPFHAKAIVVHEKNGIQKLHVLRS